MREDLTELMKELTSRTGYIELFSSISQKMEKRDTHFIICDLDDTLFSRRLQLEREPILRENRGKDGNTIIVNTHGMMQDQIQKYYTGKSMPQEILQTMNAHNSVIMTAGMEIYQFLKIQALGIEHIPYKVVDHGEEKIFASIHYVLTQLQYIPSKIIIYEDRPQYFIKYKELIETCLGTTLEINFVEMDGNNGYKKIELID